MRGLKSKQLEPIAARLKAARQSGFSSLVRRGGYLNREIAQDAVH